MVPSHRPHSSASLLSATPCLRQCQGCPLSSATLPGWLLPVNAPPLPSRGALLGTPHTCRAGPGLTPFLPTGRVPALPPLRDPPRPAGRVALPQQCQRNQGIQIHLPQHRGDRTSLSLRGPAAAVSWACAQVGAGPAPGRGPAPAPALLQPPQSCLHVLGRVERTSCASGTRIPRGAGSNLHRTEPTNMFLPLVPPSVPSQDPLNLPCSPVPHASGWVQGGRNHRHCLCQSWAMPKARAGTAGGCGAQRAAPCSRQSCHLPGSTLC